MKCEWKKEKGKRKEKSRKGFRKRLLAFNFIAILFLMSVIVLFVCGCASSSVSKQDVPGSSREGGDIETRDIVPDTGELSEPKVKLITDISMIETPGTMRVLIQGNQLLAYTSVKQPSPLAVILYFSETTIASANLSHEAQDIAGIRFLVPDNDIVASVKASEADHTSKIEILLKKDMPYEIIREGMDIQISFSRGRSELFETSLHDPLPEKRDVPSVASRSSYASPGTWDAYRPDLEVWNPDLKAWVPESLNDDVGHRGSEHRAYDLQHAAKEATRVESVYATPLRDGLKVFVGADGTLKNYKAFTIDSPARIVFDIFNVKSPYEKEKRVPVNSKWVKQVRYYAYPDRLRVVLDTKKAYLSTFSARPVEDGLEINMGASVASPQSVAKDDDPPAIIYPSAKQLHSVYATQMQDRAIITVRGDGAMQKYNAYAAVNPPRIIVDIFDVFSPDETEKSFPVDSEWVRQVRYKRVPSPDAHRPDTLQVIIDTQEPYLSAFSASPNQNGLAIHVGTAGSRQMSPRTSPFLAREQRGGQQTIDSGPPASVDLIVFVPDEAGKSSLILETSRPVGYDIVKTEDKKLELKLLNAQVPDYRYQQGALITTHFESAVDKVTPMRNPGMRNTSLFEIDLREAVPYFVEQTTDDSGKNMTIVHFEASSIPPQSLAQAEERPSQTMLPEMTVTGPGPEAPAPSVGSGPPSEITPPRQAMASRQPDPPPSGIGTPQQPSAMGQFPPPSGAPSYPLVGGPQYPGAGPQPSGVDSLSVPSGNALDANEEISVPQVQKKYTGEKIALDFFETDVKNVFRILREVSGKNFAIDKDVTGKVTLTLEHPVPWDQVLDLILKMNQLGMTYEGDIIRIATMTTIQAEEKVRQERKMEAQTRLEQQKKLEPLVTEYIAINYSNAKKEILPHIEKILSKERGTASVDDRTNMVIMTDTDEKIRKAKEIVEKLDRVTPQVLIEARIVEVGANFNREIGTQWGVKGGIQNDDANAGVGPQRSYDLLGGTYGYEMAMNLPVTATNPATIGFNFMRIAGTALTLDAKLLAMETLGEAKIVSAPKIVTLDNKKATIKQGISYPYQTVDDGKVETEFKDVDLLLEVVPHVTPDNRISMTINITKNDLGRVISGEQSFDTKEARTELLVNDGDTVVIGGIIKTTERRDRAGVPGLSKIPLLGWLFKSKSKTDEKDELLIFITPKIIQLEQRHTQY